MTFRYTASTYRLMLTAIALGVTLPAGLVAAQPIVGPQVRVDVTGGTASANETTASAHGVNPLEIVMGWNDYRSSAGIRSGFSLSMDGGLSWNDFLLRPPSVNQSSVEGDPMTAYDPRTGILWAGAISFNAGSQSGLYIARKLPGVATFEPAVMARTASGTDKCWMAAGPRPGLPDTTRVYVAYNEGVIWSDDLGLTWTNPSFLASGLGFLPRIGPNGELYISYWDYTGAGTGLRLKRSLNGGASFTTHTIATRMDVWGTQEGSRFPGDFRVPMMVTFAVNPNSGHLYAVYFDTTGVFEGNSNIDIYFTKSTDQGSTWTTPEILNNAPIAGDQFWSWIECDDAGNLHIVYLDSRHTVQDDGVQNGMFDAYYAFSEDNGASWSEHRLTDTTWSTNAVSFLGDYLGMAVAGNKIYPCYPATSNNSDPDIFTNVITIPNGAPCPWDFTVPADGVVGLGDLNALLSNWGACPAPPAECPWDFTIPADGVVGLGDLNALLSNWGPCP